MINETAVLLIPLKDYSTHRVCRRAPYWGFGHPFWLYDYEPLKRLFTRVVVYDYIERMLEVGLKTVNSELIELARKECAKYVVWPSVNYEFLESTFDAIRNQGTMIIGQFFDDEFRFDNYSKYWISHLDYCVTNDVEAVSKYRELGARALHTFVCHNVPLDVDWSNIKERYDVSFVGSKVYDREQYINKIREKGIAVHVAGSGWDRGLIPREEMIDIFRSSKINLNFSKTQGNRPGWKGRILEVINAGGFLLTEYRPGIEEYLEIGKEIICFRNIEEMIDKIIYYLNHDEERRAIAQAGWKRGVSQYTPFHMYSRLFTEIESDVAEKDRKNNRSSLELKMPMAVRKIPSDYYMIWGGLFLLENYKGLWKDALALSLSYNPFNFRAWCCYVVGSLPYPVRLTLIKLLRPVLAILYSGVGKLRKTQPFQHDST
jgi:spore maturation protein CgeB